ncbi:MAG: DUF2442 domain-containing protein [Treponema sp.]|nr:DUF2442 domain-containing protein [Treponema sp.]
MFHTIESVEVLPDFCLCVLFRTGEKKIYDMHPLFEKHEPFQSFRLTHGLFEQARVAGGGYGIYWNEDLDISCNELYINGK